MAKTSKKPTPASTLKKWHVVTATDQTDIEADSLSIEDGTLILFDRNKWIVAAWNDWRSIMLVPEAPPPVETSA